MKVSGCDLVSLLSSVSKLKELDISSQGLGREETQALVQSMESSVEKETQDGELDTEALAEYSGQGACRELEFYFPWGGVIAETYKEELRTLVRNRNWRVGRDRD